MRNQLLVFHIDMNFVCLRQTYLRNLLERVASMGYNAILWEIEDKVVLESCPEISWPEAMSRREFRDVLAYAKELNLEPIPLLQTVGHAEYILGNEQFVSFREQPESIDCYCTSNQKAQAFLKGLVENYLDLFGDLNYFHLGGDEAYVFGTCDRCRRFIESHGANSLLANHLREVAEPLIRRKIRPGIWSDTILHHPNEVSEIDRSYLIWDWNYWDGTKLPDQVHIPGKGFSRIEEVDGTTRRAMPEMTAADGSIRTFYTADVLNRIGYDVVLCSSARSFGDTIFCGNTIRHLDNIIGASQKAHKLNLLGHCLTSWAIRIFNPDLHALESAVAEHVSDLPGQSASDIIDHVAQSRFGIAGSHFCAAASDAATPFPFATSSGFGSGIQWRVTKDFTLSPKGFWKKKLLDLHRDKRIEFTEMREETQSARNKIAGGRKMLLRLRSKATHPAGVQLLDDWIEAVELQLRLNRIAVGIFDAIEQADSLPAFDISEATSRLKQDHAKVMSRWMSPGCAEATANLIYDPLIEITESLPTAAMAGGIA